MQRNYTVMYYDETMVGQPDIEVHFDTMQAAMAHIIGGLNVFNIRDEWFTVRIFDNRSLNWVFEYDGNMRDAEVR